MAPLLELPTDINSSHLRGPRERRKQSESS